MTTNTKSKSYHRIDEANVNAWPFSIIDHPRQDVLAIIIHGFTSSAFEVHDLAHYLADRGVDIEAVLMTGHGGSLRYLRDSTATDWYASVEKKLLENVTIYKRIYLIGYSFGANIAFQLAKNHPDKIRGVVSLGIPIYLRQETGIRLFLPLARIFKRRYKKRWTTKDDLAKIAATGRHRYIPIKSIVEFVRFIDQSTKREIRNVITPTLIIHARDDLVSNPRSSEYLYAHLGTQDKVLYVLNKDNHNLVHDTRRDFVFSRVRQFVNGK